MENAVEALKMAFGVFIFVAALSISIFYFSKSRETSDILLKRADETTYYEYQAYTKNGKLSENRIVGMETIIPTLYKYMKENYRVQFKTGNYNQENGSYTITGDLYLYRSLYRKKDTGVPLDISYFDISEEQTEEFNLDMKNFLTAIINSDKTYTKADCTKGLKSYRNSSFLELVGRVEKDPNDKNQTTTKTVITYILIN